MAANSIYIPVVLPLKPYLYRFWQHYTANQAFVNQDSLLGRLLVLSLKRHKSLHYHSQTIYPANLQIKVPYSWYKNIGAELNKDAIQLLNVLSDDVFYQQLFCLLDVHRSALDYEIINRKIIDDFLDYYNISEDELKYGTIRKRYYRYRRNLKKNVP